MITNPAARPAVNSLNLQPQTLGEMFGVKTCNKCGVTKPLDDFYKEKISKKTGKQLYKSICKCCVREASAKWAKENPQRALAHTRAWYHRQPTQVHTDRKNAYRAKKRQETLS